MMNFAHELAHDFEFDDEPEPTQVRYALVAALPHDLAPAGSLDGLPLFTVADRVHEHGLELVFAGMFDGKPLFVPNGSGFIATFEDRQTVNLMSNVLNHKRAFVNLAVVDSRNSGVARYVSYDHIEQFKAELERQLEVADV